MHWFAYSSINTLIKSFHFGDTGDGRNDGFGGRVVEGGRMAWCKVALSLFIRHLQIYTADANFILFRNYET